MLRPPHPAGGEGEGLLERVTISLEEELLADFDRYMARKGYQNRSEAIRDLVRDRLETERGEDPAGYSVGSVSYVYNHHQRDLAQRLTNAQHGHHDFVLSALHVHLDHENCLEVTLLRGPTAELRRFAESLIAETGVRHGHLHLTAVEVADTKHKHVGSRPSGTGHGHTHVHGSAGGHKHLHLKPKT
jgi:CopG family transcriptional regulator, nickel-responsive regulator